MPEYPPQPSQRQARLEERVHDLANKLDLLSYKHGELEKDFAENQRQTAEKFKWNMGLLMTFIGSVVLPAIALIVTLLSKGDPSP